MSTGGLLLLHSISQQVHIALLRKERVYIKNINTIPNKKYSNIDNIDRMIFVSVCNEPITSDLILNKIKKYS